MSIKCSLHRAYKKSAIAKSLRWIGALPYPCISLNISDPGYQEYGE
jgi:hypothetical protein